MLQKAEIAMVDSNGPSLGKKANSTVTGSVGTKAVKAKPPTSKSRAASPKLKKDEAVEVRSQSKFTSCKIL